jgi:hypothetical protein
MVPHTRGGVDQAAIICAEERREQDKHWRMEKNNGGCNEDEMEITTKDRVVNVTPSTHASRMHRIRLLCL